MGMGTWVNSFLQKLTAISVRPAIAAWTALWPSRTQ
jgi:hypothetical protein